LDEELEMAQTDQAQQTAKRPDREGKSALAGWVATDGYFAVHELLLRLSRERGAKVTMQQAVVEAMNDYGRKHGTELNLS
jgi:hypothetical protein